jgi:plasmid stabilization system protein ParE
LRRLVFEESAKADLKNAIRYFKVEKAGLEKQFLADFDRTIRRILDFPLAAPQVYKNARKGQLENFLYDVFYVLKDQDLIVFAVMHHRRDPDVWKKRL